MILRRPGKWSMIAGVSLVIAALTGCGPAPSPEPTHSSSHVSKGSPHKTTAKVAAAIRLRPVRFASLTVPILEYHDTAYRPNWPWALDPGQFSQEMAWLHAHHFHTISLQQLYDASGHHTKLPGRPVVITFDDGHESNYTMAYPILKQYGFVATENVVTGAIGKKGVLTAQQLLTMEDSGVFAIESHTVHHPYLARVSPKRAEFEILESKRILTKLLGRPVNFFCYPYGSYNRSVVEAVKQAGYLMAVTSNYGYANPAVDGPFTLRRMSIHEGLPLQQFAKQLSLSMSKSG